MQALIKALNIESENSELASCFNENDVEIDTQVTFLSTLRKVTIFGNASVKIDQFSNYLIILFRYDILPIQIITIISIMQVTIAETLKIFKIFKIIHIRPVDASLARPALGDLIGADGFGFLPRAPLPLV